jgi:hypothetical protein
MKSEIDTLLALTEKPYSEYNAILAQIKKRLGAAKTEVFEKVLTEELPHTTGRRAFGIAIRVAMGGKDVYRESEQINKRKATKK